MKHTLPELPYALNALEPYISEETLTYHYGKHHQAYVDNLNKAIEGTEYQDEPLLNIIQQAPRGPLYNNAAQVWNHTFYFEALAPEGSALMSDAMREILTKSWGSVEAFQADFNQKAMANFGSGWTWLTFDRNNNLQIINSDDADCIAMDSMYHPILVCDVWEHAYYIDERNARAKYLENFWKVVNWQKVEERYNEVLKK